jgi:hypothetical protein
MGDHDKDIAARAHELINTIRVGLGLGYRFFDGCGQELTTVEEIIAKMDNKEKIDICCSEEEIYQLFSKKN